MTNDTATATNTTTAGRPQLDPLAKPRGVPPGAYLAAIYALKYYIVQTRVGPRRKLAVGFDLVDVVTKSGNLVTVWRSFWDDCPADLRQVATAAGITVDPVNGFDPNLLWDKNVMLVSAVEGNEIKISYQRLAADRQPKPPRLAHDQQVPQWAQ